ncbi:uncharacterized protein F5891DRAFT_994182 [Suillus fuscotomentosus]|uniref:Uncharacterized protein n=1 Tax=Suillus fuscotomentosus TaxID=1912939 RepID=A0AAD4EQ42_9AGAM|nr:uncharacterized protein F5891DRAFT_994182 [Suillus fuscotomentosus]KAG1908614.1 hypothetical protein F5891DRAFT_994182 [Suillus fuscotomentosus]
MVTEMEVEVGAGVEEEGVVVAIPRAPRVCFFIVFFFWRYVFICVSSALDPAVIATGFENDGQGQPTAGQVASLTSSNNFINFCLTTPNAPITNGQQIAGGSCNPAPMGSIPSTANMPSAKFTNPKNLDVIPPNQAFTVSLAIQGMQTGSFTNAQQSYFSAPQQLNAQGQIQGHSHIVIEQLDSLTQTTPTDPTKFSFFKGLNEPANNGILTADVTNGLPEGTYKISTINSAANHQPVLVPIAQHGSLDDAVYVRSFPRHMFAMHSSSM